MKKNSNYEDLEPEIIPFLKWTLKELSKKYAYLGLSDEELEQAFFNSISHFENVMDAKASIILDWTKAVFEREILLCSLSTKNEREIAEIVRSMGLSSVSLN